MLDGLEAAAAAAGGGREGAGEDEGWDEGGCVFCAFETCDLGQSCEETARQQVEREPRGRRRDVGGEGEVRTGSSHVSCLSHGSLLRTSPLSLVATGLGCEYGHVGLVHSTPCLQICSCAGLLGSTTGGPLGRGAPPLGPAPGPPRGGPPAPANAGLKAGAVGLNGAPPRAGPPPPFGLNAPGGAFHTFWMAAMAWAWAMALACAWAMMWGGRRCERGCAARAGKGIWARMDGWAPFWMAVTAWVICGRRELESACARRQQARGENENAQRRTQAAACPSCSSGREDRARTAGCCRRRARTGPCRRPPHLTSGPSAHRSAHADPDGLLRRRALPRRA